MTPKHQLAEAGEALDGLDLFAKHLYPLLRVDRLDDEQVDVSELSFTHYRLTKRAEHERGLDAGRQGGHAQFSDYS
ncbi:MAG: hypothetical protein LC641_05645 [Spirochaeta sp.]|nr:hypothetical protein [Spirochaeta sp.]